MKHIVGVADMKMSNKPGDVIVTHALGSCLGIAIHDHITKVGGMIHLMMPFSRLNPEKAKNCPFMFVDTGIPAFFENIYRVGGVKSRLTVKVAGGANVQVHKNDDDRFAIGKRNFVALKKLFWQNGVLIDAKDIGGNVPRTMYLEIGSGRVWLTTAGVRKDL